MAFVDIHHPSTGKLLFRFDPARDLIEYQERGQKVLIDLSAYRPTASASERHQEVAPAPPPAR